MQQYNGVNEWWRMVLYIEKSPRQLSQLFRDERIPNAKNLHISNISNLQNKRKRSRGKNESGSQQNLPPQNKRDNEIFKRNREKIRNKFVCKKVCYYLVWIPCYCIYIMRGILSMNRWPAKMHYVRSYFISAGVVLSNEDVAQWVKWACRCRWRCVISCCNEYNPVCPMQWKRTVRNRRSRAHVC